MSVVSVSLNTLVWSRSCPVCLLESGGDCRERNKWEDFWGVWASRNNFQGAKGEDTHLQVFSCEKRLIITLSSSFTSQPWFPQLKPFLLHFSPISEPLYFSWSRDTSFLLTNPFWLKGNSQPSVLNLLSQGLCPSDCQPTLESFISDLPQAPSFQLCSSLSYSCPSPGVSCLWLSLFPARCCGCMCSISASSCTWLLVLC